MKPGESAFISGFSENALSEKLLDMGFLPGAAVLFNFYAPLGDPVAVTIGSCDVSLRLSEADSILVSH
jgi:ferrous iron transport protein A